ncbi:hypothetical protein C8J57DRAFT_1396308 [Mycena rebaudengoi]|nr:hypothetical protein C8J57DRAFT_1396308 [Mycena rebaudengoi]
MFLAACAIRQAAGCVSLSSLPVAFLVLVLPLRVRAWKRACYLPSQLSVLFAIPRGVRRARKVHEFEPTKAPSVAAPRKRVPREPRGAEGWLKILRCVPALRSSSASVCAPLLDEGAFSPPTARTTPRRLSTCGPHGLSIG